MKRSEMEQDILKVLVSEEQIQKRVAEMGAEIYDKFKGKEPLFLGVLKGSFVFMADLVRACQLKSDVEFIAVSSYQNATKSSGTVKIVHDLQQDITGRDIIVVEDILDSGNTLYFLKNYFLTKGARSITIATLLDKPSRREKDITPDYVGFEIPDEFVKPLSDYAIEKGLIDESDRSLFETAILGAVTPIPSQVNDYFRADTERYGSRQAVLNLYDLGIKSNYIKLSDVRRNI